MKKILESLKSFVGRCKRVWMVLKKPSKDEFWKVAAVSALGILVIGVLGFFVSLIVNLFI